MQKNLADPERIKYASFQQVQCIIVDKKLRISKPHKPDKGSAVFLFTQTDCRSKRLANYKMVPLRNPMKRRGKRCQREQ
jgi:hypothetical protein